MFTTSTVTSNVYVYNADIVHTVCGVELTLLDANVTVPADDVTSTDNESFNVSETHPEQHTTISAKMGTVTDVET